MGAENQWSISSCSISVSDNEKTQFSISGSWCLSLAAQSMLIWIFFMETLFMNQAVVFCASKYEEMWEQMFISDGDLQQ